VLTAEEKAKAWAAYEARVRERMERDVRYAEDRPVTRVEHEGCNTAGPEPTCSSLRACLDAAGRCGRGFNEVTMEWWARPSRRWAGDCRVFLEHVDRDDGRATGLLRAIADARTVRCLDRLPHDEGMPGLVFLAPYHAGARAVLRRDPERFAAWAKKRLGALTEQRLVKYDATQRLWAALDQVPDALRLVEPTLRELAGTRFVGWWHRRLFCDEARRRLGITDGVPRPQDEEPPWDPACPGTDVPGVGDGFPPWVELQELWPWAVRWEGEVLELGAPMAPIEVEPSAFPEIEVEHPYSYTTRAKVLPRDASALLRLERGWVVGTNFGEFGGGLWWIADGKEPEMLVIANVVALLRVGAHVLAVDGMGHGGIDQGALIEIRETKAGVDLELFAELPARPRLFWVHQGHLLAATAAGVMKVDQSANIEMLPCVGGDPELNMETREPDRRNLNEASDQKVKEHMARRRLMVAACFDAVPPPSGLPGSPERHLPVQVYFVLGPDGKVVEARPYDTNLGPPGVAECIAHAAQRWAFPGVEYPARAFVYEFGHPIDRVPDAAGPPHPTQTDPQ